MTQLVPGLAAPVGGPDLAAPTLTPEPQELPAPSTRSAAAGSVCAALPQAHSQETACASSTCGQGAAIPCSSRPACPAAQRGTDSSPWHVLPPPSLLLATPPAEPACQDTAPLTPCSHLLLPWMPWQQFPVSKLNLGTKHNTGHRWSMRALQDARATVPALVMPANYKSNATSWNKRCLETGTEECPVWGGTGTVQGQACSQLSPMASTARERKP